MRKFFALLLFGVFLFCRAPAQADTGEMTGEDIRHDIVGHRIYLAVPAGGEFPLNYRDDGTVTGDGKALGLGAFMAPTETGRWWISDNQLCEQFKTWYDGSRLCFRLVKLDGAKVRWTRDNGENGTARIGD